MALFCSKKISTLSIGIISKHKGDFYCLNYLHSCRTKKIKSYQSCENKDFCNIVMPSEDIEILEFNQYQKFVKATFIIYADLEYLAEKIDGCKNNPENLFTTKVGEYIPSGFSMSAILSFKSIKNKHDVYKSKECMKKFCESLREQAMEIVNFKKKK